MIHTSHDHVTNQNLHRRRIQTAQSVIDSSAPYKPPSINRKLSKAEGLKAERQLQINLENSRLVRKIIAIDQGQNPHAVSKTYGGSQATAVPLRSKEVQQSRPRFKRYSEMYALMVENVSMVNRLIRVPPTQSRTKWADAELKHQVLLQKLCRHPLTRQRLYHQAVAANGYKPLTTNCTENNAKLYNLTDSSITATVQSKPQHMIKPSQSVLLQTNLHKQRPVPRELLIPYRQWQAEVAERQKTSASKPMDLHQRRGSATDQQFDILTLTGTVSVDDTVADLPISPDANSGDNTHLPSIQPLSATLPTTSRTTTAHHSKRKSSTMSNKPTTANAAAAALTQPTPLQVRNPPTSHALATAVPLLEEYCVIRMVNPLVYHQQATADTDEHKTAAADLYGYTSVHLTVTERLMPWRIEFLAYHPELQAKYSIILTLKQLQRLYRSDLNPALFRATNRSQLIQRFVESLVFMPVEDSSNTENGGDMQLVLEVADESASDADVDEVADAGAQRESPHDVDIDDKPDVDDKLNADEPEEKTSDTTVVIQTSADALPAHDDEAADAELADQVPELPVTTISDNKRTSVFDGTQHRSSHSFSVDEVTRALDELESFRIDDLDL